MSESLCLFQFLPKETLIIEYKNWSLKYISMNVWYSKEKIYEIVTTGKLSLDFNIITEHNLYQYLLCYIPKYISVYGNATDIPYGEVYIGISDCGEITGIPYLGILTDEVIIQWLSCENHLIKQVPQVHTPDEIIAMLKFEIILINIDKDLLYELNMTDEEELSAKIDRAIEKRAANKQIYKKYVNKKRTWSLLMQKYSCSIFVVVNDSYFRKSLIAYIKTECPDADIIQELLNGSTYDVYTGAEISIKKEDKTDIYYWVTRYKDAMIARLKQFRPATIGYTKRKNIYNSLLLQLSTLRGRFIRNNPNINYYVIKITFPTNLTNIYYYINKDWTKRTRCFVNGEPGCIPNDSSF